MEFSECCKDDNDGIISPFYSQIQNLYAQNQSTKQIKLRINRTAKDNEQPRGSGLAMG